MNYKKQILTPEALKACEKMNALGSQRTPFIFIIDYGMNHPEVFTFEELEKKNIFFKINDTTNYSSEANQYLHDTSLKKFPISFEAYHQAFGMVKHHLQRGDSFLINLTQPTPVETEMSLLEIFERSQAKYKLYFQDQFVLFSPETFVGIQNGIISSHPMKGTISANIPNAEEEILKNKKELAEHTTIVDLIRNDISIVAEKVWVERFRYIDRITTNDGDLLQVSSEICGILPENYHHQLGTLLFRMLPAGSITGAPKPQTIEIIREAEGYNRGFYTGVFGIFDGENLDSSVMIRFIEKTKDGLIFKSGGGITVFSDEQSEYQEMIDKVYLSF